MQNVFTHDPRGLRQIVQEQERVAEAYAKLPPDESVSCARLVVPSILLFLSSHSFVTVLHCCCSEQVKEVGDEGAKAEGAEGEGADGHVEGQGEGQGEEDNEEAADDDEEEAEDGDGDPDVDPEAEEEDEDDDDDDPDADEDDELTRRRPARRKPRARKSGGSPAGPTRPQSAYMLFVNARRKDLMAQHPGITMPQVGRKCGEMWRSMGPEERAEFQVAFRGALLSCFFLFLT